MRHEERVGGAASVRQNESTKLGEHAQTLSARLETPEAARGFLAAGLVGFCGGRHVRFACGSESSVAADS